MTILPAKRNMVAWRGGTFRKVLTLYTGNEPVAGTERDLTGYTASLTVEDQDVTVLTLTTENGGITLGGTAGTVSIYISDETTTLLPWTNGIYQLFLITPTGDVEPLLWGNFGVKGV